MGIIRRMFVDVCTESRLELDAPDMERVQTRFVELIFRNVWWSAVVLLAFVVTAPVSIGLGISVRHVVRDLGGGPLAIGITAAIVVSAVLGTGWFVLIPKLLKSGMRQALRDCGYDICRRCGYSLAQHGSPQCPECGTEREAKQPDADADG